MLSLPPSVRSAEGPRVSVRAADDARPVAAVLLSLTASQAEVLPSNQPAKRIDRPNLRSLSPIPLSTDVLGPPPDPPPLQVVLTSGDWIAAHDIELQDESLTLTRRQAIDDDSWSIPLEFVRAILSTAESGHVDRHVTQLLLRGDFAADTLLLANGDRFEGEVLGWTTAGCQFKAAGVEHAIAVDQLLGLILDPALSFVPVLSDQFALVMLIDGSRLSANEVTLESEKWQVTTTTGFQVVLPRHAVQHIDFFSDRIRPLSIIAPVQSTHRSYLSRARPYHVDRNAAAGALRIGEERFGWGIGVWSGSRMTWDISEGARSFEATVGIDAAAQGAGSADFVVLVDGVERARSGRRTGADPPFPLGPVPLADADRLELIVEYADQADIQDIANWCQPTLLK